MPCSLLLDLGSNYCKIKPFRGNLVFRRIEFYTKHDDNRAHAPHSMEVKGVNRVEFKVQFCIQMVNFVFKMMSFVLKRMN